MNIDLHRLVIRHAVRDDVASLVALLADDVLGRAREQADGDLSPYLAAFDAIEGDPGNELLVAVDGTSIVAMLQITYTPGLSRQGAWRATVESVRVRADARRNGVGRILMQAVVDRARSRGCKLVQLTTDLSRQKAYAFYKALGFRHSHAGFKLPL